MSANSVHLSNRRDSERTLEHCTRAGRLCPGLGCREPTNHAHDDFTSRAIAILMAKARHSSSARACCFRPKFDTLTARIFSGKKYSRGEGRFAKIRYPHRAYISKSDGLWYRPSKLKKVSTEMKLEKVSTESPSIVKL